MWGDPLPVLPRPARTKTTSSGPLCSNGPAHRLRYDRLPLLRQRHVHRENRRSQPIRATGKPVAKALQHVPQHTEAAE